jgi:hypothetical protein
MVTHMCRIGRQETRQNAAAASPSQKHQTAHQRPCRRASRNWASERPPAGSVRCHSGERQCPRGSRARSGLGHTHGGLRRPATLSPDTEDERGSGTPSVLTIHMPRRRPGAIRPSSSAGRNLRRALCATAEDAEDWAGRQFIQPGLVLRHASDHTDITASWHLLR